MCAGNQGKFQIVPFGRLSLEETVHRLAHQPCNRDITAVRQGMESRVIGVLKTHGNPRLLSSSFWPGHAMFTAPLYLAVEAQVN